jgi:hypothetical protein
MNDMSDAKLGEYLKNLAMEPNYRMSSQYTELYDDDRRFMNQCLRRAYDIWNGTWPLTRPLTNPYQYILQELLYVNNTCIERLKPVYRRKFNACKAYLQNFNPNRTPSPHRERRGNDTPEPKSIKKSLAELKCI